MKLSSKALRMCELQRRWPMHHKPVHTGYVSRFAPCLTEPGHCRVFLPDIFDARTHPSLSQLESIRLIAAPPGVNFARPRIALRLGSVRRSKAAQYTQNL